MTDDDGHGLPPDDGRGSAGTLTVAQAAGLDGLTDVTAALACACSCHLRRFGEPVGDVHDGGTACPCQLSVEERRTQMEQLLAGNDAFWDSPEGAAIEAARDADEAAAQARAEDLGLSRFTVLTRCAPLQIEAVHDGAEVCLRSRRGTWRVEVAGVEVASGTDPDDDTLVGWVELLWDELDRAAAHRRCRHTHGGRFCPDCGVRLERP